jgi:hypothetical protein
MLRMSDETGQSAIQYLDRFGDRAWVRICDDISKSIASRDWDRVYFLQRAQLRIRRYLMCENAGRSGMEARPQVMRSGLAAAHGSGFRPWFA